MSSPHHAADIAALRAFNRLYTNRLGLLHPRLDHSSFSLSEARVLYELAHRDHPTGAQIARALNLDPAQVSRTVKRFVARGLVETRYDPSHGRHLLLVLTDEGRAAFAALEDNTCKAVGALLETLPPIRRQNLLAATRAIGEALERTDLPQPVLRGLKPGDLGMIAARQGLLYGSEYSWNSDYEALVAGILADFHKNFAPEREQAWIAEIDGRMAGSIFLVQGDTPSAGKLRLLYVEPDARGTGVATMLVEACIARARAVGYQRLDLWTTSVLVAARRLYERAGFQLAKEAPIRAFGHDLIGQTWSLAL